MSDEAFIHDPVDAGFDLVTAAVNPPEVTLTEEGKQALKVLAQLDAKLTPQLLAAVARDVAMDILTSDQIIAQHGLTHAQFEYLSAHNEYFKQTLLQQVNEWQRIGSTQDRLRAQSAAALEAQLPTLAGRMGKQTEKLADVVEAAKFFAKVAGVDAVPAGARGAGEGFTINIDLGADERLTIRSGGDPQAGAGPAVAGQIPQIPKAA